jgi:pimeloyl-ACP methyl ester carboxylesterase
MTRELIDIRVPVEDGVFNVWHRPAQEGSETVALIPGITSTSRYWTRVIDRLPAGMGVAALDVRGRGASSEAPPPYDLKTIADDVIRVFDTMGVEVGVVAGWSMGAWVAALVGTRHPARVSRVLLIDGALPGEVDPTVSAEERLQAAIGPALQRLSMRFESVEGYLEWWSHHPSLNGRWQPEHPAMFGYDLGQDGVSVRVNRSAVIEASHDLGVDPEVVTAWERLEVPTTLVVVDRGMLDQPGGFMSIANAEKASRVNSFIDMVLLSDLNHYTVVVGEGAGPVAALIAGTG